MAPGLRRRLPPLNAVRAFEAAARHASFSRAAAELGVTHGAVSRQVALLEDALGTRLFTRSVRQIALTPAGQVLLAGVAPALERIADAAAQVERAARPRIVRVNVRPSFALRWLIPHLPRFLRSHPELEPQVATSTSEPAAVLPGSFDIAIRRGLAGWPDQLRPVAFLRETAMPVASPSLLQRLPVRTPPDLAQHTLLHCATRDADWAGWLERAGAPGLSPAGTLRFEHLQFSLQAALDGLGVALGPTMLVEGDLKAGRLAAPLRSPKLRLEPYCFAVPPGAGMSAMAFANWLIQEGRSAC